MRHFERDYMSPLVVVPVVYRNATNLRGSLRLVADVRLAFANEYYRPEAVGGG